MEYLSCVCLQLDVIVYSADATVDNIDSTVNDFYTIVDALHANVAHFILPLNGNIYRYVSFMQQYIKNINFSHAYYSFENVNVFM